MPDIPIEHVMVPGVDGDLRGQLLRPTRLTSASCAPAVVVVPEVDGFCEGTVAAARRLCDAGYVALALDLYTPYGTPPRLRNLDDTIAWILRLDDRRQIADLSAARGWLSDRPDVDPDRTGVVGFSIGGRYSMLLAAEPGEARAAVAFYAPPWVSGPIAGTSLSPGEYVDRMQIPVCAVYGDEDEFIPRSSVERFRALLAARDGVGHQVSVVPGRHYFANESRPRRFDAASTDRAWKSALTFLDRHVAGRAVSAPGEWELPQPS